MLNLNTVKKHIEAGHEFYWDARYHRSYELRAVTYTWENGNSRTRNIYTAPNYEIARLVCQTMIGLNAKLNVSSLEKIADERWLETGSK